VEAWRLYVVFGVIALVVVDIVLGSPLAKTALKPIYMLKDAAGGQTLEGISARPMNDNVQTKEETIPVSYDMDEDPVVEEDRFGEFVGGVMDFLYRKKKNKGSPKDNPFLDPEYDTDEKEVERELAKARALLENIGGDDRMDRTQILQEWKEEQMAKKAKESESTTESPPPPPPQ